MNETALIVIGSLHTDIVAAGVKRFPRPGELVYGKELVIGPGGKSRNIAAMAGQLSSPNQVAMIGHTAEDSYGLWKPPIEALNASGVNTDFVQVVPLTETTKLPAIALIPVNEQGENQIIVLPGVSDDFSPKDVDAADQLFDAVERNNGYFALTLECPLLTVEHAVNKAKALGIKVVFDPGGIEAAADVANLLDGLYLLKPNEHEVKVLTGIEVTDFASARVAAGELKKLGVQNVLITHGDKGAYLFTDAGEQHILVRPVGDESVKDATGAGDQAMATLCAYLQAGKSLEEAAKLAVLAGTLQFHKAGIQPVTQTEINANFE